MNNNSNSNVLLLVEDNPADADLTRESFAEGSTGLAIEVANDGADALSYLRRERQYDQAVLPRLIMLDLNLPRLDGRAVLRAIKSSPTLRKIPTIVVSSSTAQKDIADCYDLGASCYLAKPLDLHAYREMIRTVERFWFEMVSLPNIQDLSDGPA
jgi:chemotaxis family two-component system response regulator Rcp1